jgi:hypothetical protein
LYSHFGNKVIFSIIDITFATGNWFFFRNEDYIIQYTELVKLETAK